MFYAQAQQRLTRLAEITDQAERHLESAPEGRLKHVTRRLHTSFYHVLPGKRAKHIPSDNLELAEKLAQKSYDQAVLRQAKAEIAVLTKLCRDVPPNEESTGSLATPNIDADLRGIQNVYSKLSDERKRLVIPYVLPKEEYAKVWESEHDSTSLFREHELIYPTEKGHLVRSKSEVIIADRLYRAGVPYQYEPTLMIDEQYFRPDFVVLKASTREEYVWEHFGMMSDPDYCTQCLKKIRAYASEGYVLGQRLLATFESSTVPLDLRQVDSIIQMLSE